MRIPVTSVLALIMTFFFAASVYGEDRWVFEAATGTSYSFPTTLKIEQDGEEDIDLTAEYDTNAWSTMAPYYDLRIGKWKGDHAWEFESLHQKLYLSNKPAEVQEFAISHGYNLNTVNYAWQGDFWDLIYRVGLGFVLAHPETEVRGKSNSDDGGIFGFYLSGITSQVATQKRFNIFENVFLYLEAKLTASYAVIPIADGSATVPNVAAHGLFGIGYKLDPKRIFK